MFGKIFEQIYDSSIAEDWTVRTVFQDFIVLADINGVVDRTPEAISRRTNVPIEVVKAAIAQLESPDPRSRSPDENGARIVRLDEHRDWGWMIVNYQRFREIASDEQRREKTRVRVARFKLRHKGLTDGNAPVTLGNAGNAMQKQKQKQKQREVQTQLGAIAPPVRDLPEKFKTSRMVSQWQVWQNCRRAHKKPNSWPDLFNAQLDWLERYDEPTAYEILGASIRNGWQGLFEPKNVKGINGIVRPAEQIRALDDEIQRHPANRDSKNYRDDCTQAQRDDLKSLRTKRSAINSQMARI